MAKPILLYTPIFEDTAESITNQLFDYPKNEDVKIWMNTPGGSLSSGWTILAAMNQLNLEIDMTVVGDAASFGFFMLLFAKKSRAYDTSSFMIHRAASFWEDIMTDEELKEIEVRNKIIRTKLETRINEEKFKEITGKSFDDIFSMEDRLDVNLTAKQANEIGLIDEVITLDVAKRQEIENRYFQDIAALSSKKTINSNNNDMGKLTDLIFGEKDPILVVSIGDKQFAYSKLEKGVNIKAIGKGDYDPFSGTFEAEDKKVTVVENEITAVTELDKKQKEIDALKEKLAVVEGKQITVEDVKEVVAELQKQHSNEIKTLKESFAKAKLAVSKPKLPEGDFIDDIANIDDGMTRRERIQAEQNKAHEEKLKARGA